MGCNRGGGVDHKVPRSVQSSLDTVEFRAEGGAAWSLQPLDRETTAPGRPGLSGAQSPQRVPWGRRERALGRRHEFGGLRGVESHLRGAQTWLEPYVMLI